jgi:hypothetical protein
MRSDMTTTHSHGSEQLTTNKITAIVVAALAGIAIWRYFSMSPQERYEFKEGLKARIHELIDDAEGTSEKAKAYMAQLKSPSTDNVLDKLVVVKKIIDDIKPVQRAGEMFGRAAAERAHESRS